MTKNKLAKILVPVIMVFVIALIFVWQTFFNTNVMEQHSATQQNDSIDSDFELVSSEINLDDLKEHNLPIIIDFGADECVPCVEMAPVLVNINEQMQGKAIVKFVDVWKNPNASNGFPVQVIPTQIFVNADGTPYIPSDNLGIEFVSYSNVQTGEHIFTVHQGGLTEEQMNTILEDMGAL